MQYVSLVLYDQCIGLISAGSKKLKCSGEQPTCSRCQKKSLQCIYAPQKTMGRPRKRRLVAEDDQTDALQPEPESTTAHTTEPVVANGDSVEAQGDPDDTGDWFEGGGIFSTLLPKVRASPWPALEEVPAVCRTALRSKDAVSSTTSVPELTER